MLLTTFLTNNGVNILFEPNLVMELIETLEGLRRYRGWFPGSSLPIRKNAMMLLMFLHHNLPKDGPGIQPSELGEMLRLTRPTITSLVNSLEEHHLVERIDDADDRRVVFVRPTEEGTALVKRAKHEFAQSIAEIMEHLGTNDGQELIRIMRRVRGFLDTKKENQDGSKEPCGN